MSINIILYQEVFQQIYSQFCFDSYSFIFRFFSSDTLQVLMFVSHTVLEIRFYGCCHPCYDKVIHNIFGYLIKLIAIMVQLVKLNIGMRDGANPNYDFNPVSKRLYS